MVMKKSTFGKRLTKLRKQKGLSQRELAELLNVSKSAVGMYEIDKREPSFQILIEIKKRFEVSLDYLIAGEEL